MTGRWVAALLYAVALLGACDEQRPEALIRVTNSSAEGTVRIWACRGRCDPCPGQCVDDGGPDAAPGDAGSADTSVLEECTDPLQTVTVEAKGTKTVAVFAEDATGRDRFYLRHSCPCNTQGYGNLNIDLTGSDRPVRFDVALRCDGPPLCTSGGKSVRYCQ